MILIHTNLSKTINMISCTNNHLMNKMNPFKKYNKKLNKKHLYLHLKVKQSQILKE